MIWPTPYVVRARRVVPSFFGEWDAPWLHDLLEARSRFEGRRRREWDAFWEGLPLPHAPPAKLGVALFLLDRHAPRAAPTGIAARRARDLAFVGRALYPGTRDEVLARVAAAQQCTAVELETELFADIAAERRIGPAPSSLTTVAALVAASNLDVVRRVLQRATVLSLTFRERVLDVVRRARGSGLIITVSEPHERSSTLLQISGPLAVVKRTTLYGRALASLVPSIAACGAFRLEATVMTLHGEARFELRSGDAALAPAPPGRRFDSKVEARFANDVARLAPRLALVREPEPVRAAGTLVFPDFAIYDPLTPNRRHLVEIVGFWTPEYLARKLRHLRAANLGNLILCIDEDLACGPADMPADAEVLRYRNRIDAREVLARLGYIGR